MKNIRTTDTKGDSHIRFITDHDYHIHSGLSLCSANPDQTPEAILRYSKKNGFKKICLTNPYWDETVPKICSIKYYDVQNTAYIEKALPLPQDDDVQFRFGAEVDMDKNFTIGIRGKMLKKLDFIVISTMHFNRVGFTIDEKDNSYERRADIFVKRFDKVLAADLPFRKMGLAHITSTLLAPNGFRNHMNVLDMVDDKTFKELFTRTAKCGMGVELNLDPSDYSDEDIPRIKRLYLIAKECGCKFYMASDAHHNKELASAKEDFERRVDFLDLTEEQKFKPFG